MLAMWLTTAPLSLIVWWRPDQDRGPLGWALQAHLSTFCTRRHIIELRSFRPSAGVFLWDAVFDTAGMPCCMLAVGMSVRWLKQVVIVGFVVLAVQLTNRIPTPFRLIAASLSTGNI